VGRFGAAAPNDVAPAPIIERDHSNLSVVNDLILGQLSFLSVFTIDNCSNCTFQNFGIDYLYLPFTQVTVQTVDSATNTLTVTTQVATSGQPPYQSPYQLYLIQNIAWPIQNIAPLHGFDFRNGLPQYSYGRWDIKPPTADNGVLVITDRSSYLDVIQPGDTFVVEARGGGPAISLASSSAITLSGISVYKNHPDREPVASFADWLWTF